VPERVEAESAEGKRFLQALRGILKVPKSAVDAKVRKLKANQARKRKTRERKAQADSYTQKPKA
jgi:hypothetical protein